jgi:hypothetical protein
MNEYSLIKITQKLITELTMNEAEWRSFRANIFDNYNTTASLLLSET